MKINLVAKIEKGQDGAIWNNFLFRLDHLGKCYVYNLKDIEKANGEECPYVAAFILDKVDELMPHSNSVMFGNEFYSADDEFPLIYTNIYNNYAKTDNPMKGVTLVYRLQRNGLEFYTTLVQIIEIGFVEDHNYWKSSNTDDIRPYGNFVIDREHGIYYAFTMRDESNTSRYFSFDLPTLCHGVIDEKFGVNRVVLNTNDIKDFFDCPYHRFIQGASFYKGNIYSLEGFTNREDAPPAMRIIDVKAKSQSQFADLVKMGCIIEPEMIDFDHDNCYYGDSHGNLYIIEF